MFNNVQTHFAIADELTPPLWPWSSAMRFSVVFGAAILSAVACSYYAASEQNSGKHEKKSLKRTSTKPSKHCFTEQQRAVAHACARAIATQLEETTTATKQYTSFLQVVDQYGQDDVVNAMLFLSAKQYTKLAIAIIACSGFKELARFGFFKSQDIFLLYQISEGNACLAEEENMVFARFLISANASYKDLPQDFYRRVKPFHYKSLITYLCYKQHLHTLSSLPDIELDVSTVAEILRMYCKSIDTMDALTDYFGKSMWAHRYIEAAFSVRLGPIADVILVKSKFALPVVEGILESNMGLRDWIGDVFKSVLFTGIPYINVLETFAQLCLSNYPISGYDVVRALLFIVTTDELFHLVEYSISFYPTLEFMNYASVGRFGPKTILAAILAARPPLGSEAYYENVCRTAVRVMSELHHTSAKDAATFASASCSKEIAERVASTVYKLNGVSNDSE